VAVLAAATVNVLSNGPLVRMDTWVWSGLHPVSRSAGWQWLGGSRLAPARLIVDLADPRVAIPGLLLVALAVGFRRQSLRPLVTAAVAVGLLVATVIPAKILIGRLSPGQLQLLPGHHLGAFPSGHTTTATVCYTLAALLLGSVLPASSRRVLLTALPAWFLLVGAALVWCDFHWVTDVVAGWALAAIIVSATRWLTCRDRRETGTGPGASGSTGNGARQPDGGANAGLSTARTRGRGTAGAWC
jgi:undecaprenyl-diphosphatase